MFRKMKTRKRLAALITLITLFAFSSVMTVMTAAQEASLISATLTTDKESYDEGENVNIALTVKNGNIYGIDKVKSEIGLPDGLTLKKGELTDGEYALAAGQSRSNEITAYIEKASKPGDTTDPVNPGNPETDGSLCPLWLTLSILSGGTLAVLGIKKKCGKRIFSLFLCAVISLTALPTDVFADEVIMPNASGSVTASKDITVNGAKKTITADITYNENKPSEEDEVTVTFDAGDGTPVAPITVKKGETISRLPESFGAGKAFMGWFTDTALTNELFTNTPINEDMTVYASFVESADDFQSGVRTTYYVEDCAEYQPITLICDEEITANNVWEYITLFAYTGDTPENFVVTSNEKDEYTLVPETAYTAGCMYRMTAGEGVTFKGLDDTVNEYTFKIYKPLSLFQLNFELSLVVKMNFAGGIGSKFSILDATQVGTHGNSKDKEFSMYKNKLLEGDRYSFDLTVFGYVGVKMGVSGQLTVSFTGLRRLGEVGVEVQVGAYLDIYGLAKYHVVKPDHRYSTVYRTLTGGFYLEAGIYLEVNLVAESKVFKLRLEAPLIPEIKWPLFSMGDKDLVICLNDITTPILFSSNGTYWGEINVNDLPAVSAQTLDITTGVINYNASVPWSKLSMNVSGEDFRMLYDRRGRFIRYEQPYTMSGFYKNSTAEGVGQIHYTGTSLQFTKTADPEMSLTKSVKVIWYDESRVKEEDVGKIFTVNFYREVDGVKTLVETRKVPAGSFAGSYNTNNAPDSWMYIDCKWKDKDPYFITVDHDNYEIVYTATRAQTLTEIEYYDTVNKEWVVELWAVNAGDVLKVPDNSSDEYMKLSSWHATYGVPFGFEKMYKYAGDKLRAIDSGCRKDYYTSGQPTDKPLYKVTGNTQRAASENFYFNHHSDYQKVALHFSANYDRALMNVTYNYYNYAGDKKSTTVKTPYGTRPEFFLSSWPYGKTFMGYTPDGGKTLYDKDTVFNEQLPYVYEDTVYDAVYEAGIFDVEIQYYDDTAREFKTYKTLKIEGGSKVPQSVFDEAWSKSNWQEGTTIQFFDWCDVYLSDVYGDAYLNEFIPDKTLIYKSIILRPRFKRNVTIKLDAGDGRLIFEESKEFKSYSQDKYEVEISRWATKDADKYNDYQPTGWKDSTTGEIYALGQTVKLDYSTTLTAIYQATPKTYTVNVSTPYGALLNGEKTDKFSGGYDDYLAFVEKYNNYTPADVEGEGYTLVFKGSSSKASEDGLTLDIVFGNWQKNVHKHTLILYANGGKLTGSDERTADYGTQIKLSDMAEASKTDDLRDYIFGGWKDEDGNIYGADDIITLTKDTTLTAVWKNGAYKEYTITFVLDDNTIKRVTYHYGDALPTFGAPEEADGYIFGGWSWFGTEGALSGQPDTMPASTLTAIGTTTKCYISYEFDGAVYGTKEVGKIGDTITLIAKPEKDYYDVTEWTADGITVTDGKFVMPARNVIFKATSSPKFYNVNMTVDGSISSDSPMKAQYMSTVTLPEPPKKSGYTYYWQSDDVAIYEESGEYKFTMPHNDVSVECVYTTATYNVYYMIDGEATPYMTITDVPAGKEMFAYIDPPRKEGYLFNETWICTDVSLVNKEGRYTMPDRDVYFCGRFAKNDDTMVMLGVEVYVDGNPETHYTLYTNRGETVTLPDIFMDGYTKSYESDKLTITNGNVTIPTGDDVFEVSLRINFTKS